MLVLCYLRRWLFMWPNMVPSSQFCLAISARKYMQRCMYACICAYSYRSTLSFFLASLISYSSPLYVLNCANHSFAPTEMYQRFKHTPSLRPSTGSTPVSCVGATLLRHPIYRSSAFQIELFSKRAEERWKRNLLEIKKEKAGAVWVNYPLFVAFHGKKQSLLYMRFALLSSWC